MWTGSAWARSLHRAGSRLLADLARAAARSMASPGGQCVAWSMSCRTSLRGSHPFIQPSAMLRSSGATRPSPGPQRRAQQLLYFSRAIDPTSRVFPEATSMKMESAPGFSADVQLGIPFFRLYALVGRVRGVRSAWRHLHLRRVRQLRGRRPLPLPTDCRRSPAASRSLHPRLRLQPRHGLLPHPRLRPPPPRRHRQQPGGESGRVGAAAQPGPADSNATLPAPSSPQSTGARRSALGRLETQTARTKRRTGPLFQAKLQQICSDCQII